MKQITIFTIWVLFSLSLNAQFMPDSNVHWQVEEFYYNNNCNSATDRAEYVYSINGDTLINGITYNKIYKRGVYIEYYYGCWSSGPPSSATYFNSTYVGGIHEQDSSIYLIFPGNISASYLVMSFNVNAGDTIFNVVTDISALTTSLHDDNNPPPLANYVVDSIKDTLLNGTNFRTIYSTGGYFDPNTKKTFTQNIGYIDDGSAFLFTSYISISNNPSLRLENYCWDGDSYINYYYSLGYTAGCSSFLDIEKRTFTNHFKLSPNPTTSKIYLQSDQPLQKAIVTIYNLQGKQVIKTQLQNNTVDMSELESGMYLLEIDAEGRREVHKVRKE